MHREVFPNWHEPPAEPAEMPGSCIDVWRIQLPVASPGTLADGYRELAQGHMRGILARYIGVPADQLPLVTRSGGKPSLDMSGDSLEFNLSHSRGIALLAVSCSYAVGIDVETYRELPDPVRIARRALAAPEVEELLALPEQQRLTRFLSLWTRMEARQKALGRGIFARPADPASLSSFSFRPGPEQFAGLSISPPGSDPQLRFFDYP